jgi:CBS domain-containing protein
MTVQDIMSRDPICCRPDTDLGHVAAMMAQYDCGEIPVCDDREHPIGVVTDRDVICRVVARGRNPLDCVARDCMSQPVVAAKPEMRIEEAARLMEDHQVRRLPVVDDQGVICGMVAQADLATKAEPRHAAEVVQRVSTPSGAASRMQH